MAKMRGAHSFRPRVRQGLTPPVAGPSTVDPATAGPATVGPSASSITAGPPAAVGPSAATAGASPSVPAVRPPDASDAEGSSSVAPAQRRYHTLVGPTPPAPSHPRPAWKAPPAKRAWTSGQGESSTSRSRAPPSPPYQGIAGAPDLSPASIIRRPYFPCDPIPGNVSWKDRYFHGEVYYDLPAFAADPRLRDSMLLVQRYHLEPFMVPHQFFYPRLVIEF